MSKGKPIPIEYALKIAKKHMVGIAYLDTTEKIAIVGSLRRKAEEVKDIDYQVITTSRGMTNIENYFWDREWTCVSGGTQRLIVEAPSGVYVNVFNTQRISWGAALMHNTGPSRYNIRKRAMIKRMGYTLNQYGLYKENEDWEEGDPAEAYTLVANETEKDIYEALSWAYCKPEDRE